MAGRKWAQSEEAMMTATHMCQNVSECLDNTFDKFVPRKSFELIKTDKLPRKKIVHKLTY
jgi:hypothetical protein